MDELVITAENQKTQLEALMGKLREFAQPRSAYTIEKHIVCAQETPEVQYKQVLDELWARLNSLQDVMDERELCEIELEEAEEGERSKLKGDEALPTKAGSTTGGSWPCGTAPQDLRLVARRKEIEMRQIRRKLVSIDYRLEGLTREIEVLLAIKSRLPEYTWEQFEASQAGYWEKRLARQWWLAHIAPGNQGNLDAILNLFTPLGQARPEVGRLEDAAQMLELSSSKLKALQESSAGDSMGHSPILRRAGV